MRIPLLVGAAFLAAAVPPIWPYAYYSLLRVLVCGIAIAAIVALRAAPGPNLVGFIIVGLLFNPIAPVHLNKPLWSLIDLVAAAFFVYVAYRPPFSTRLSGAPPAGSGTGAA
jgi:hypothetical protein